MTNVLYFPFLCKDNIEKKKVHLKRHKELSDSIIIQGSMDESRHSESMRQSREKEMTKSSKSKAKEASPRA